jgi:AcrR family transcriptional regulator
VTPTRRDRHRTATIEEIKRAALDQIAEHGAASLTIRGVARAIGMSPAGMYRYFDSLDELVTELLADAYAGLADAVEAGIANSAAPALDRFAAGASAYRRWALDHRNQFLLIFGTPIPGYAAPAGGPTVDANRRMGAAFFRVGVEAWAGGEIGLPVLGRPSTAAEIEFAAGLGVPEVPPELVAVLIGTWTHLHGLVTLELLEQLRWMYHGTTADTFFDGELRRMLDALSR